ncbi:MAG: hypothetical protein ACI9MC_000084 [Kiritimatiellia bacterium]|jgi:hypothetical protein
MSSTRARIFVVTAALISTLLAGTMLRWFLAGQVLFAFDFKHLRHAHSHLGIFGVLFPLAWVVWTRHGAWTPTVPWRVAYWAFISLAIAGFLRAGYGVDAIIGSTGVLLVWLVAAWRNRRLFFSRSWLGSGPGAIVLACMSVLPVATLNRHQPEVAHLWVQTFVGVLILGVIVPTAVGRDDPLHGPPPVLWLLLSACTALQLGALPTWWTGLGTVGLALCIAWYTARKPLAIDVKLAWGLLSLGLMGMGLGVVPLTHHVGVGALHLLMLGPVMLSLAPTLFLRWPHVWVRLVALALAGSMSLALVLTGLAIPGPWLLLAAGTGTALAAWWTAVAAVQLTLPAHPDGSSPIV